MIRISVVDSGLIFSGFVAVMSFSSRRSSPVPVKTMSILLVPDAGASVARTQLPSPSAAEPSP